MPDYGDMTRVAVLFSGGRDSTLAALRTWRAGRLMDLLMFESGLGVGSDLRDYRIRELKRAWGGESFNARLIRTHGLVRRVCFVDLVEDIERDRRQLILLGEFLSLLGSAIHYCRRHTIQTLVFGAVQYQDYLPEQQSQALVRFAQFAERYGINLETPVSSAVSELSVKLELAEAGLLPKSLEGYSVLADVDDSPPIDVVLAYIERKFPIIESYLDAQQIFPIGES